MYKTSLQFLFKALILSLLIFSCSNTDDANTSEDQVETTEEDKRPNILLIIADDMGLDATPGYNIGAVKPNMPTLDSLMQSGIKFNNTWANPTCSPTRGTIITGKYGFRTGVTEVGVELSTTEASIQKYLDTKTNNAYSHAVIGKWHLSKEATHPNNIGVGYYEGTLGGGVPSYTNWSLTTNGVTTSSNTYVTTAITTSAINWVNTQTKPWFLWLAYNAPHTPFHLPPNELHSQGALAADEASINSNPMPYYMAAMEAMDTEMGRLMNSMSTEEKANTIIIFVGDNGSPGRVAQAYPNRRSKGSLYQGGVNVPLVVSGKYVESVNSTSNALVNTTDLFATIADAAGTGTQNINDSQSFLPLLKGDAFTARRFAYAESGPTNALDVTIRNETHKYILFNNGLEALYNLMDDEFESVNLLNANRLPLSTTDSAMRDALVNELNKL